MAIQIKQEKEEHPTLIRYYCDQCGFEQWDHKVITNLMCECGYWVLHEEWEG